MIPSAELRRGLQYGATVVAWLLAVTAIVTAVTILVFTTV